MASVTKASSPRCVPLPALLRWVLGGALFAGGAVAVARLAGPRVVRDLGNDAGQGIAEGMVKFQAMQRQLSAAVSGRWA